MPNARKRKLQKFTAKGFKRMAAVFVLPDEALFERQRRQSQEEGKQVPEVAMADMRGMWSSSPQGLGAPQDGIFALFVLFIETIQGELICYTAWTALVRAVHVHLLPWSSWQSVLRASCILHAFVKAISFLSDATLKGLRYLFLQLASVCGICLLSG